MFKHTKKTAAIAAAAVLAVGGGAYAATQASQAPTPLTGSITDKVSEAALAKYQGATLTGVESRPDGTFEAHVRKSDGTFLSVTLDKELKVTGSHEGGPGGRGHGGRGFGGPGGPGHHPDAAALAKALGVTEAKLKAAFDKLHAAQDKGTRPDPSSDRRDEFAAALAKELGLETAKVQAALEAQRPAERP